MASTTTAPKLQIAQILADLSDLFVADPTAAQTLVTAHQAPFPTKRAPSSTASSLSNSQNLFGPPSASASRSDKTGSPRPRSLRSPSGTTPAALSREESSASMKSAKSHLSGPDSAAREELDPDMERASALLRLYENRGRLKQQEIVGLARARANVEAVGERYRRILGGEISRTR